LEIGYEAALNVPFRENNLRKPKPMPMRLGIISSRPNCSGVRFRKGARCFGGSRLRKYDMDSMMDRYDNHVAIAKALQHFEELKVLSQAALDTKLMNRALELIRNGELVVIKPALTTPPPPSVEFYKWTDNNLKKEIQ
jgi:hypothetical protein